MLCCHARILKKLKNPTEVTEPTDDEAGKIPFADVKLESAFSSGATGLLCKARFNGKAVAAKEMAYWSFAKVKAEATMLAKVSALNSRYFLHYYGYTLCLRWETTRFMAIVTELMTGDLSTALKAYRQNMSSKIDIMSQIAHGVEILHQHHIIHRDLKSNNILVNVNTTTHRINDVKIGDFGGAVQLDSDVAIYFTDNTWGTTKRWTAPEGFRCEYSKAYDIYSLGILFWEIITDCQRPPFANIANDYEVGRRNYQNDRWNPLPLSTPTAIAKLITRCNHFFPEQRPNATQVVEEIDQLIVADVLAAMVTEIVEEKNDNKAKLSTR